MNRTIRIETHVHTKYSKDSLLCFWSLYLKCRIKHIDCIAITEHNNIRGGVEFKKFCEKRGNKISVIVGEEVFTDSGEIIGLFLSKEIPAGLSPEETIRKIKEQDGVVYVPHPYDVKRSKTVLVEEAIVRNKDDIDCIEIHNGRNISPEYGIKQQQIASKYGIRPIIGSDAHTFIEVGRNYIEARNVPDDRESFLHMLQDAKPNVAKCILMAHKITVLSKVVKMIFEGKFHELYGFISRKIKKNKH